MAVELKSQNGPSYGNNANNRVEEAVGNVVDLRLAHEAGLLSALPWTGFVFVIEDEPASRRPNSGRESSWLSIDPTFATWSYVDRVRLLCERLVREGLYAATWAVASSRPSSPRGFTWTELDQSISGYAQFADSLAAVVSAHYA